MSDDKIAEIRDRHAQSDSNYIEFESTWDIHADRATLLAEVDRQSAEIERLRDEDTKTRHALKGWVFVCPDGGDEPTHERVAAVVAEVERLRAALRECACDCSSIRECAAEGAKDNYCLHLNARAALEGKP